MKRAAAADLGRALPFPSRTRQDRDRVRIEILTPMDVVESTRIDRRGETHSVLSLREWKPLANAHADRADAATAGHRARAVRGERHAVEDFLYDYYSLRPGHLRRWHPGIGIALDKAADHARWKGYRTDRRGATSVDVDAFLATRGPALRFIRDLISRTLERPPHLGCFGLHEWAMVYRAADAERRHGLPLRLGPDATNSVVETHRIRCTHYDAYRFFTPDAAPLNQVRPTRETQPEWEQPGCLHATMDLLKWAWKLTPLVPGDLTLDAFDLAREIRRVDMQASPYDVSRYGLDPIAIETPEGKRRYADLQRSFAERGNLLRRRLLTVCTGAESLAASRQPLP